MVGRGFHVPAVGRITVNLLDWGLNWEKSVPEPKMLISYTRALVVMH